MKKAMILMVAFLISIPLGLAAQTVAQSATQADPNPDGYYAGSYVRLSYVSGDVFVQRTADLGYEKGEINYALIQGDKLATGNGQAEVQFGGRNYLRLDNNTRVEFALLPTEGDNRMKIHVLEGSAYLRVGSLAAEKAVEVHTPDASCYILEEGLYRFDVRPEQESDIFVREGSLEAAGEQGSSVVRGGESVVASGGRLGGEPSAYSASSDDFDQWNASRDSQYAQPAPTRYLPSDLSEYETELDQNGHWTYENPYGYVWVPYVAQTDWEPYSFGRWCWYPEIGWNWISSEPWGWPVYHYGRWHWRGGLGWYWIPSHRWGPAWVHWWWDRDYVGWCPLSWYNRPVVFEHNRFFDRYGGRDFPIHNRAMTFIRRDRLQDPGVERHRLRPDELGRIGRDRISLGARQPGIQPVINRGSLQTDQARRVFSGKSGVTDFRGKIRNSSQGRQTSPSTLRRANEGASPRAGDGTFPSRESSGLSRNRAGQGSSEGSASTGRVGRTFPSRSGNASSVNENSLRGNRDGAPGRSGAGTSPARDSGSRIYPSRRDNAPAARPAPQKGAVESKSKGSETSKQPEKSQGRIKNYPSSLSASSGSSRSRMSYGSDGAGLGRSGSSASGRTFASRVSPSNRSSSSSALREFPSRSSSRSAGRSPSSSSMSGRTSTYTAPSRGSSSRTRSYSQPSGRSNLSRPSGSSSRSYSGSSSTRSYSAPSRSSRSYSTPSRSSRSLSSPSRSSSRSYSSPSRSSSRSYSAPSRSSRSYSSPSRSSRSFSSPSRSSSRSSGSSARSSSRGGSSGRSSGGSRSSSSSSHSSSRSSSSSSSRSSGSRHKG